MTIKTAFVPKEFTNELTNMIEKNPQVEEVLCSNLLSQTCRNEGQKFLNYFYNPEELEEPKANLPNLDHLIDLSMNKDCVVNLPKEKNKIGQINRNASNILSAPGKRFKDLSIKDPQKRLFRALRNFINTPSAYNTMFAGHFVRILENYFEPYVSEFKPESIKFYQDDFSIKNLVSFMIHNIHILPYREFLIRFITDFSHLFPDETNFALEEILSQAGRFIFALKEKKTEKENKSKLISLQAELPIPDANLQGIYKIPTMPDISKNGQNEPKKDENNEISNSESKPKKNEANESEDKRKKSETNENDRKIRKSDTDEKDKNEYKRKKSDGDEKDKNEYKRKKSDTTENDKKTKKSDADGNIRKTRQRSDTYQFPPLAKKNSPTKESSSGEETNNQINPISSPIIASETRRKSGDNILRTPQPKLHRNSEYHLQGQRPLLPTSETPRPKLKRQRSKIIGNIEVTNAENANHEITHSAVLDKNDYYEKIAQYQPISIESQAIPMPLYMNPEASTIPKFDELSSEYQKTSPLLQSKSSLPPKLPTMPPNSPMRLKPKSSGKKNENKKFEYVQSGNILDLLNDTEATPRSPKISRSSNSFTKTKHMPKRMSLNPTPPGTVSNESKNIPISKTKDDQKSSRGVKNKSANIKPNSSKSKNSVKRDSQSDDENDNDINEDEQNQQANYIYYYNDNQQTNLSSLESSDQIRRSYIDIETFDKTMKDFVKYDDTEQYDENCASQSAYFLITIIKTAISDNTDFFETIRKNDTLLKLLLICGTFSDDDTCLSSEIFTIIKQVIEGNAHDDEDSIDDDTSNEIHNDENSGDNNAEGNRNLSSGQSSDNSLKLGNNNSNNSSQQRLVWKVPDFVADFAEYFTFDPYNVTQKMISAFPVFWNYRSPKYDVYSDFCYNKVFNKNSHHPTHQNYPELILDYPQFEGQHYTKPPGKTPLEVMTPVFFTEPPLSDQFNRYFKNILWNLGKRRMKLAGQDITKSKYISEIIDIDLIYVEFMRNQFDLSLDDPKFQRLTVISAIEKMLEINPCSNYWQENNTVARAMLNGHILKLTSWTMKYDFLVVGKNKELSRIAFGLPSPKAEFAANYPQTTFDIKNLISRYKNKMMNIDLGFSKSESDEEENEVDDGMNDL